MTIAEVSKEYGISADTLRYYERIGLLPPIPRNSNGNRDYREEDCRWVKFIKCMRSAGLSIESLIEYVTLFQQGTATAAARKAILQEQRQLIIAKIEDMQNTLQYLDQKLNHYEDHVLKTEEKLRSNKE